MLHLLLVTYFDTVGWYKEEHLACKNWLMRCWFGYLSGARCILFAYDPADATASLNPIISCLIYIQTDFTQQNVWCAGILLIDNSTIVTYSPDSVDRLGSFSAVTLFPVWLSEPHPMSNSTKLLDVNRQ